PQRQEHGDGKEQQSEKQAGIRLPGKNRLVGSASSGNERPSLVRGVARFGNRRDEPEARPQPVLDREQDQTENQPQERDRPPSKEEPDQEHCYSRRDGHDSRSSDALFAPRPRGTRKLHDEQWNQDGKEQPEHQYVLLPLRLGEEGD